MCRFLKNVFTSHFEGMLAISVGIYIYFFAIFIAILPANQPRVWLQLINSLIIVYKEQGKKISKNPIHCNRYKCLFKYF